MDALYYLLGVLIFVFAILASIGLHEMGHMIPAKKFGGKVTQYFIGFGPTVWSRQRGDTEYGVKAIPLGGYVKIVGMLPPGADEAQATELGVDEEGEPVYRVRKSNTGLFTQLISDARAAEWELVGPEDHDRLFYRMPWWKKVIVMAAGPSVNILIAFVIFTGVFATYGNPNDVEPEPGQPVLSSVSQCVIPYSEAGRECTAQDPPSPAAAAGLRPGDTIIAFNGHRITEWQQFRELVRNNDGGRATIVYARDGERHTTTTSTTVEARPVEAGGETLRQVGFLGVTPEARLVTGGPLYTLGEMGEMTVRTLDALVELPVKVWGVGKAIIGLQERSRESPVSIVGGGRLAGETVAHDAFQVTEKLVFLLMLIAGFNFFIGMFNFVPLLPLDGGHIAGALYEAVRRGFARLRRRPDPGFVDVAKLLPVAYVFGAALLVMGVVLIVGDIVVPIHLVPS